MAKDPNKPVRRPSRILLWVLSILVIPFVLILGITTTIVRPYFAMINGIMAPNLSTEENRAEPRAMTQEVESEAIVLLENKGALPLGAGAKVNVYGVGVEQFTYGGTGSGSADESVNTSLMQGLRDAGLEVNEDLASWYKENTPDTAAMGLVGTDWNLYEIPQSAYPADLLSSAADFSDTAIVVITRRSGEGGDLPMDMAAYSGSEAGRSYLELTPDEEDLLEMAKSNHDKVIVIINSANAMELGFLEDEGIDAAIWVGTPGSTGTVSIGDVLIGSVNPSGRLVDTYPYEVESAPSYYAVGAFDYTNVFYGNAGMGGSSETGDNLPYHFVDYVEGIYVGYRYYETAAADGYIDYDSTVQYPFGYGMSYTTFEKAIESFSAAGDTVTVRVNVTNTGSVAGKDVAQIYVNAPYTVGGIEKAEVVLAGFAKTKLLEPGESQTVEITFNKEDIASYDYSGIKAEGGAYVLEAGTYEVRLQDNSHDMVDSRTFTVGDDIIYNDANDGKRASDLVTAVNRFDDMSYGDGLVYVSRADWAGTMPTERRASGIEATPEQIAIITDTTVDNPDVEDIVVANHGLKLSDMAGLAYDDPQWDLLLEQVSVNEMAFLVQTSGWMNAAVPSVGKPHVIDSDGPNGANLILGQLSGNQYTGQSMLGATWNTELVFRMGEVFGAEAHEIGVGGLYAPACNIHRSPFAGRNYEYVSEDGFLSGAIVEAEIRGIQSKGVYTYLKHFALNDQETNRDNGGLVTWANEQAMREIYLKPFEMGVKLGHTLGIMSSFNRIGAVPAAESYPLLTEVLRGEWGFQGAVITDCVMAATTMDFDRALRAGNDLELSFGSLPIFAGLDGSTLSTPAGHQALRQATKNILFMTVNSDAMAVGTTGPYPLQLGIYGICALMIGLYVWYLVRRHKKMVKWRAQQAAA
ncbi:MAG: glycoside hydrolase family 3 C-terminal domain-containing protein [Atopobiaceae bacterium]|nr:glycoside hydrolase family 3 C-terminal domain-containing protein [Atopobiaceae bacterium]